MVYIYIIVALVIYFEWRGKCPRIWKKIVALAQRLLSQICANLIEFIHEIICSKDFLHRHRRSERDFTRQRKLPFPTLIIFLIDLITGSYQNELNRFFRLLIPSELPKRFVSKVALARARMKLEYEAFVELNEHLVEYFYQHMQTHQWHGFNLLAVDGSLLRLPRIKSIMRHFGVWHPQKGDHCPMARVSQMFDPINQVSVDTIISPKSEGERELAAQHFFKLTPGDLVLLDRGYPAYWLFNLILSMGGHFCARVSAKKWKIVRRFFNSGKRESSISLPVFPSSVGKCKELGLDLRPLKLRLLRVELDNGEVEILITSLTDKKAFPFASFPELYHLRWPVEEDYKKMKSWIQVENFSGKSVLSVYQDFHAKVFTKNLTSVLAAPTRNTLRAEYKHRKHEYQINYAQAFAEAKRIIPLLFLRPKEILSKVISALHQLLIHTVEPVRPGRKFPRKHKKQSDYYFSYKTIG
jgi:hypothetical protein